MVSPPKTRNFIRTLALPQQVVDLLTEEHTKHPRNPYLFPSPKTGTMYNPDAFRRTHDKILKAIGGVISQQMRRKKQGRYFPYLSPCGPTCESWRNGKNQASKKVADYERKSPESSDSGDFWRRIPDSNQWPHACEDWIGPPSAGFRWNETGLLWDFHTRGYAPFHCFRPAFFCSWVAVWVNGKFPFAKAYQPSHYEDLPPRKPNRPGFVPNCKTVLQSACRRAILSP